MRQHLALALCFAAFVGGCTEQTSLRPTTERDDSGLTVLPGSGIVTASPRGAAPAPGPIGSARGPEPATGIAAATSAASAGTHPSLIWTNKATGERVFWDMNGATYAGTQYSFSVGTVWQIAGSADFSCDGKADLLWRNSVTGENVVWFMNGPVYTGQQASISGVNTQWAIAAVADFTGDGKPDIVWQNRTSGERAIWHMNCLIYAGQTYLGAVNGDWDIAAAADLSGDGKSDIIWQNTVTGERVVWFMNSTTYVSQLPIGRVATVWDIVGAADMRGDATPDLLWQNTTTGERVVWQMAGGAYSGSQTSFGVGPVWELNGAMPLAANPPTVSVTAVPVSVTPPQNATITWTSTNAVSCTASWNGNAAVATSGSQSFQPTTTTTYSVTCTNGGGSAADSKTVTVTTGSTNLLMSLTGLPSGILGDVTVSGPNFTTIVRGTQTLTNLTPGTYTIGARIVSSNVFGEFYYPSPIDQSVDVVSGETATATVVYWTTNGPTATLTANPSTAIYGQLVNLAWTSTNATGCTGSWTGAALGTSGNQNFLPPQTTTVSVTCTSQNGSATAYTTVNVVASPTQGDLNLVIAGLPPGASASPGVDIKGNNFSGTAYFSASFPHIEAGTYIVTAPNVSVNGVTYTPTPASQSVTVVGGATSNVTVTYAGPSSGPLTTTLLQPSVSSTLGTALSFTPVVASGGVQPYTYSISGGTLPSGLNFNTNTGQISGTPSATLASRMFTITARDATAATSSKSFSLAVVAAPASLTLVQNVANVIGTVNVPLGATAPLVAMGGQPPYVYTLSGATLATGLSFNSAGQLIGTPTATLAPTVFTVRATDVTGASATGPFTLSVVAANAPLTTVTAIPTVTGTAAAALTPVKPVVASGGRPPYSYSISPSLPSGLTFSSTLGEISGTPASEQTPGNYIVRVTDSQGATSSRSFALTINPRRTPVLIFDATLPGTSTKATVRLELLQTVAHATINPNATTWIVVHGRMASAADMMQIATAIQSQRNSDQVLFLDWEGAARETALWGAFSAGEQWIEPVGRAAAAALANYGFSGTKLNLVGHSWGSYVSDELAEAIAGVNLLVALDPAENTIGSAYDPSFPSTVNFALHAGFSLAITSSPLGSVFSPATAHRAFYLSYASFPGPLDAHSNVKGVFAYMVNNQASGRVSGFFALDKLLARNVPVQLDKFTNLGCTVPIVSIAGIYDGCILDVSAAGRPNSLRYFSGNVEQTLYETPNTPKTATASKPR